MPKVTDKVSLTFRLERDSLVPVSNTAISATLSGRTVSIYLGVTKWAEITTSRDVAQGDYVTVSLGAE